MQVPVIPFFSVIIVTQSLEFLKMFLCNLQFCAQECLILMTGIDSGKHVWK